MINEFVCTTVILEDQMFKNSKSSRPPDWEQKHKLAAFHQSRLNNPQQSAIAANVALTAVFTVGMKLSSNDHIIMGISVILWLVMSLVLTASFSAVAVEIRAEYEAENRGVFGASDPIPLHSFLLSFHAGYEPLVRWVRPTRS